MPVWKQARVLGQKLRGHYGYFGITGNSRAVSRFLHEVQQVWRKWLDRRSQHRTMSWERFGHLQHRYPLPPAVLPHSLYRAAAKP